MLEALGLEPDVEAVYRLLLAQPEWSVQQIAQQLDVESGRVRAALDVLAELHLLQRDAEGKQLLPVSPDVGLGILVNRHDLELRSRLRRLESARASVAAIVDEYGGKRHAPEIVQQLHGVETVRRRLEQLAETARKECLSFFPGGAQRPDTMESSKPLDQMALERGVSLRTLYQDSIRNDPDTYEYVRWLSTLGAETRTVPTLPMLMVLVDREVALVPIDPEDGRQGALEIRSRGVVEVLYVLFTRFWDSGMPWHEQDGPDNVGLSRRERELMYLLASGHTDEAIAKKLGVSLRTVRRTVSGLMARLEARSRFEAGVLAARAGWLS
ncbi:MULTISPECIES: helix-turn-helix domain-containing protein [Streptomyces]|uniref:helix-turn-helix domain-containing protein n=1 Tax=Streptomyces TaxID=1883 RepID=UPI0006AD3E93|nr:helix-turn-helix transcriptional regulator [Streptomyces sp. CFMR 7]ALC29393.1 LuxR family transcriptional regulator [Streptomyces sp. CFMR 7]